MEPERLVKIATKIRQLIITSLAHAKSGHTAGALGMADIFTYLYFKYLKISTTDPWNDKRDRFILSNGHVCAVLYATLALRGYFNIDTLKTLRAYNSKLQGHPHYKMLPGIENTSGPLGQGISQAIGVAIGTKNLNSKTVCIISDGELQEGQTWEALMFIGNSNLKNLTIIIDRNNIQISGFVETIMPLEPLIKKLESFNLVVFSIDGNNIEEIQTTFAKRDLIEKPVVIIANTIPGFGVDFIENDFKWHGKVPNNDEAKAALNQLKT